jgi:divalent metal cation (Fe/Co/Zn/Cd) transporter
MTIKMEETNSSLKGLCDLIANQGAEYAHQHTEIFLEIIRGSTDKVISREQVDETFKIFAFLNWALVSRIWSYMKNTTLRKDLKSQIYKSIVQKTSYELSEDKSNESVDLLASELDQEFRELALSHNAGVEGIAGLSARPYADKVTLVGLKWLQEIFDLNYEEMDVIESQFNDRVGNIAKIEDSAREVNRKANQRERGFFKRLFGS